MKKYRFALKDFLADMGINVNQAWDRYFKKLPKSQRLSRGGLYMMCGKPKAVNVDTITKLCNAFGIEPGYLWRSE